MLSTVTIKYFESIIRLNLFVVLFSKHLDTHSNIVYLNYSLTKFNKMCGKNYEYVMSGRHIQLLQYFIDKKIITS